MTKWCRSLSLPLAVACLSTILIQCVNPRSGSTPTATAPTEPDDPRWFPTQARPKALVRTIDDAQYPQPRQATRMMVQSIAGLAAKSVNHGHGDEMVWVATTNPDLERWYTHLLNQHPPLELRGVLAPWDLVDRYQKLGIIKGYVLYKLDRSPGAINERRPGMDLSVNVATSLAGLLDAILIDQALEPQAKAHGLPLLLDARDKTQAWCFETYKSHFNRRILCTQDPKKPHVRDLAIAQQALTLYGDDDSTTAAALQWLQPLAPILGWNGGDEFQTTRASTVQGHLQTATDWCMNLPVLMAAGDHARRPARLPPFDPRSVDWQDRRSAVAFVCSDGDNVQFFQTGFFANPDYWAGNQRGQIPFGWSCCFASLAQLCPPAVAHALATRTPNDSFIEWGGGYYYPDLFARDRPDRWDLLARHARHTWEMMKANGTAVIGFNVADPASPDARKACEVFAAQTDALLAILVFQYAPYEGGAGQAFWVQDRRGVDVPVITARYSIWEHANHRPRSGTPAKVAREIRATVAATPPDQLPRYDWVIAHAWSYFRPALGADQDAENLPQSQAADHGGQRGYAPVTWCAQRLQNDIKVVSPEELIWRIRMKHDPRQTRAEIAAFPDR
jgi:hypothetical protein